MVLDPKTILFPHEKIRKSQSELVKDVIRAIETKSHLIAHAPTGLGKTAATLAPAIKHAIDNKLNILFLTSRHTQHQIAIDTVKKIKEKYNLPISATSIIGKKWMCLQPAVEQLSSGEFSEFCKLLREDNKCEFYSRTKVQDAGSKTIQSEKALGELIKISPVTSEQVKEVANDNGLCPYELGIFLAEESRVIVTDYYYVFHPKISENFFNKAGLDLKDCIIIIDEGHNLPNRIRELLNAQLSEYLLDLAIKEAQKFEINDRHLFDIKSQLDQLGTRIAPGQEQLIKKETVIDAIQQVVPIKDFLKECAIAADTVLDHQKRSFIASVAEFVEKWQGPDDGFARIISQKQTQRGPQLQISYKCLDPSVITKKIINESHSTIMMSGTLTPTTMYKDLMRFPDNTEENEYSSPFDEDNRLALIVPKTSTKFTKRSPEMYKQISQQCLSIVESVPGNVAIFFPSYKILEEVNSYMNTATTRTVFQEHRGLSKTDKQQIIESFKRFKDTGAILLGVAAGSFGEGVDLPGDLLKGVIVVGVPLGRPDLETKELIRYYDQKFNRGWDYGYILPAMTKILQNAGRCIRTEEDRGVIAFIDERFSWPQYLRCFPRTMNLKIKPEGREVIKEFFEEEFKF